VLVAARLIARCGNEAQKSALLPALADGSLIVVFAHGEAGARYDLARVETRAHDGKVSGQKRGVIHAPCADKLIVSARIGDAVRLFLVDRKDAISRAGVTLDGLRTADIELQGAKAEPLVEGDALGAIEDAADYAAALACAEAVGAMKSANDATLEYLKTRKQFGVPIGAFQALQHRMVAMVIECEQARSMAALACARVDADMAPRERARIVSAAKIKIGDAARRVSQESVQLHGGMGMSDELKVSHTFRRLTAIAREWGDVDHHLERFARASRRPGEADVR
jgi:alkylation response protein AidB-like acyl-CoA dehydrogenase